MTFFNKTPSQKQLQMRWLLPEGWSVEGRLSATIQLTTDITTNYETVEYTITAGENITSLNRPVLEVMCQGRPTTGLIPIVLLG